MKMRKWLSFTICLILLSVLVACGNNSTNTLTNKNTDQPAPVNSDNAKKQPEATVDNEAAEWKKVVEAAKKEGKIVLSGTASATYRDLITSFKEEYPEIQVDYSGNNGSAFFPKIYKEREVNQYLWDFRVGSTGSEVYVAKDAGILEPLTPFLRPDITKDSTWIGGFENLFGDNEKKYVLHFNTTKFSGIDVNHDVIPEGQIKTFKDLLDPKYKGKIVLFDPRSGSGSGNQAMAVYLKQYGEDAVKELFTKQELVISNDMRQVAEWVIRGRYPISIGAGASSMIEFQEKGLGTNVKTIIEENVVGTQAVIMFKNAPHPNAARVFLDWLLSKKVQEKYSKEALVNSRRSDVKPVDNSSVIDTSNVKNAFYITYEKNGKFKTDVADLAKKLLK